MLLALFLIIYGSIAKNRWGINLDPVRCPRCGVLVPMVRKPASFRQALWGGNTCSACRAEVDKWGREIGTSVARS
jgi:hypothetical protein